MQLRTHTVPAHEHRRHVRTCPRPSIPVLSSLTVRYCMTPYRHSPVARLVRRGQYNLRLL
ncbi:hypothetical protein C8T65DRAFT_645313 [Cerioporus squamosus]|nr:hypothetical protein C8T65DRAFT_645313 [Cerioporus squamosus]